MLGRQGALNTLDLAAQLLQGALVLAHVNTVAGFQQLDKVLHDSLVKVLTTQVSVAVGGQHLEDTIVDGQ